MDHAARTIPAMDLVQTESVRDHLRWLTRLRWIAIVGILAVIILVWATETMTDVRPHVVIVMILAAANFVFWLRLRQHPDQILPQRAVVQQVLVDMLALAALLHWSDGLENPFAMFFTFHMAIASKLLRTRSAYGMAVFATLLQGGIVTAEHLGILDHHPMLGGGNDIHPDPVIGSTSFLAVYFCAFSLTNFGIVFFMQTMAHKHREADKRRTELERLANSRERLAYIGELSAGVAHAIRNPVHGMLNCVDLLRTQVPQSADGTETLELLDEGLHRISTLTRRLLIFSRQAPMQRSTVSIDTVVEDALSYLRLRSDRSLPVVHCSLPEGIVAEVDANHLTEALVNVLDNAVDACTSANTINIAVSICGLAGELVCIEVRDEGAGVSMEHQQRVFDPFFSTKPVGEGTGLGLAITRRIIKEHGGRIEFSSEPTVGTTVRLLLPRQAVV